MPLQLLLVYTVAMATTDWNTEALSLARDEAPLENVPNLWNDSLPKVHGNATSSFIPYSLKHHLDFFASNCSLLLNLMTTLSGALSPPQVLQPLAAE